MAYRDIGALRGLEADKEFEVRGVHGQPVLIT